MAALPLWFCGKALSLQFSGVARPLGSGLWPCPWGTGWWHTGTPKRKTPYPLKLVDWHHGPVVKWAVLQIAESPWGCSSLLLKDEACSQLKSSTVPSCKIEEVWQPSSILSISCPFSSNWQCFYLYNPIISVSSDSPARTLVFSEHAFSFFATGRSWEFFKSLSSGSFFPSLFLL